MSGTREGAIARARASLEEGRYVARLAEMVAYPTESQIPDNQAELLRYLSECLTPRLEAMGFDVRIFDNPRPGGGPILLGRRIEDPARPTAMIYGHGDVVAGQVESWRAGLDPWTLTVEGDRIYGRGTADSKGQHLVALEALEATLAERGRLGFNVSFMVEMGEEVGSPGIGEFLDQERALCAADIFIGLDGPRQSTTIPELRLGARGGLSFDLEVSLRDVDYHSGHWGGLLKDAGFLLAHALATIVTPNGRILVEGWTPRAIPEAVQEACRTIRFEQIDGMPEVDVDWGEPGLSRAEQIFAWTSVAVLAFKTGRPEAPVNAVQGRASARLQVRYDVEVDGDALLPALRRHLDTRGFEAVRIVPVTGRDMFPPARTDPASLWVRRLADSMQRTTGIAPNIIPNSSGGNPSAYFMKGLDAPVIWVPNSYAASGQHAADEHVLIPIVREGLGLMAGIFWDMGKAGH